MSGLIKVLSIIAVIVIVLVLYNSSEDNSAYHALNNLKPKTKESQSDTDQDSLYRLHSEIEESIHNGTITLDSSIYNRNSRLFIADTIARNKLSVASLSINDYKLEAEYFSLESLMSAVEDLNFVKGILLEIERFGKWDSKLQDDIDLCKKRYINVAVNSYPKLRSFYYKLLKNKLWEDDIDVQCLNKDCSNIQFIGGIFLLNRKIKNFMELNRDDFYNLHLKKVSFKGYKSAGEFSYVKIDSQNDNEL